MPVNWSQPYNKSTLRLAMIMDGLVSPSTVFILPLFIVLSLFCIGGWIEAYTLEIIVIGVLFDLFRQRAPTSYTSGKCYLFL